MSLVGTTIEYYDFFIYGTAAALVLGPQFFPSESPVAATLAAFATFAVGFLARPLGGVVMGHYGDRVGRKHMLMISLLLMGVATALIGLLPNYASIGVLAPALLVFLRFVQGFAVGGELGGAVLMSFEHAPARRRALYGSFPMMGLPLGIVLSTLVFLVVQALVPAESFDTWGWRIPFLLAIVIVGLGAALRAKAAESPEFAAAKARGDVRRAPIVEIFSTSPREVALGAVAMIAGPALGYLILVYLLSYGTTELGLSNATMLSVIVIAALIWVVMVPLTGVLADRFGRKPVFVVGCVVAGAWAFPLFALVDTGDFGPMVLAASIGAAGVAMINGVQGALLSEAFPVHLRYSGISLTVQIGTMLGGAIAPLVATALLAATGSSSSIALYMVIVAVISLVAVLRLNSAPDRFRNQADPTPRAGRATETPAS
ncbi:MFS transporter [Pseudonocardia kongjuensis]|uniref:MFS transporter n=1 Tax=Pseudonocardia kongjuensis TaxID=102227 RepID=A0ABP4I7P0_9PSEU